MDEEEADWAGSGGGDTRTAEEDVEEASVDSFTDKIIKTIPTEVVTAWLFIHELVVARGGSVINGQEAQPAIPDPVYYFVLAFMILLSFFHLIIRTRSERDMIPSSIFTEARYFWRMSSVRKRQILLGTAAFVVWVMYLGGPIEDLSLLSGWYDQTVGAIFLATFTVAIPVFIPKAESRGQFQLLKFNFDEGDPDKEYIDFLNSGSGAIDLSSWTVRVNDRHQYEFPSGFELEPDTTVTLWGGQGEDTSEDLYWGRDTSIGDDRHEIVVRHSMGWKVLERPVRSGSRD